MWFNRTRLTWLSFGIGAIALGVSAGPAGADGNGYTLQMSAPSNPPAGQPFVITASGVSPPSGGVVYLDIYEIPASVTTTCPAGYLDAGQLAGGSGGDDVAFYDRETTDASGNFSMPVAFTPSKPGGYLFCGYTDDEATDTLAAATLVENAVSPGGGGGGGGGGQGQGEVKPMNTGKPHVSRSGNQLRCTRGSWANAPTHFAYHWVVGSRTKAGATSSKLTITHGLHGHKVRCGVKASNAAGSSSALSAPFTVH
ncbi:MAG TPA: hypothetical protein VMJ65_04725 [Solirubrobacteraceae bacterium]|nr:hypothetical protein [Solirubrobacteraceae bacterium]